eukprot:6010116-Amphidinium_carterae.2
MVCWARCFPSCVRESPWLAVRLVTTPHQSLSTSRFDSGWTLRQVVETTVPFIKPFVLPDLLPYKATVEKSIHWSLPFSAPENGTLRQFWSLVAETAMLENTEREEGKRRSSDKSWHELIHDWQVLPVCTADGTGEDGEELFAMHQSGICCAVSQLDPDMAVQDSLDIIVQEVGIAAVQGSMHMELSTSEFLSVRRVTQACCPLQEPSWTFS